MTPSELLSLYRDLPCPRCGYNLRGLTTPRCPECGLEFPPEDFAAGELRENNPTWLDRADLWQPHQVLLRSLVVLTSGVLRPGRMFRTVDLTSRASPAIAMLFASAFWLWVLCGTALAASTFANASTSPAAALRAGFVLWGPRLTAIGLMAGAACALPVVGLTLPARLTTNTRAVVRLAGYAIPVLGAWCCILSAAVLVALPDFSLAVIRLAPMASAVVAAIALRPLSRPGRWIGWRWYTLPLFVALMIATEYLAAALLFRHPLDPPWWVLGA